MRSRRADPADILIIISRLRPVSSLGGIEGGVEGVLVVTGVEDRDNNEVVYCFIIKISAVKNELQYSFCWIEFPVYIVEFYFQIRVCKLLLQSEQVYIEKKTSLYLLCDDYVLSIADGTSVSTFLCSPGA